MSLTKVDWLGWRTQAEIPQAMEALTSLFGPHGDLLSVKPRKRGYMGFEQAADIRIADMHVGLLAYGGESQKGWLSFNLSGRGCEWVHDWDEASGDLMKLPQFETRRVDIALDTFKREVTHETVLKAYRAGLFATHGRPPKMSQIIPEDPYDGSTIYIGKRDQAKFFRGYTKGYELVSGRKDPDARVTHIDGIPIDDIYRLELELKPKNGPLPLDLIQNRDQYFAGAYPYLQTVLDVEPEIFQQSREKGPQRDMETALAQIRHQYGSTLFTALAAYHGDVGAVMDKIMGKKHNDALLANGVLMVDHE